MEIKTTEIKTEKEGFNNCPTRETLLKILKEAKIDYAPVDIVDKDYWKNNLDRLVIMIAKKDFISLAGMSSVAVNVFADECYSVKVGNFIVFNLWWD